jgi:thioredoxin 1
MKVEDMSTKSAGGAKPLVLIAIVAIIALGWFSMRTSNDWLSQPSNTKEGDNMAAQASASGILHADDTSFESVVLQSDVPVLVDFYADWCGPCRMLAPLLEQLAGESNGVKIVKLNIDNSPGVAARFGVNSIPTLILFKGGEPVNQTVGLLNRQQLRSLVGI